MTGQFLTPLGVVAPASRHWKFDREGGAGDRARRYLNLAAMVAHDRVRDGQAKTGPLTRCFRREERIEDAILHHDDAQARRR